MNNKIKEIVSVKPIGHGHWEVTIKRFKTNITDIITDSQLVDKYNKAKNSFGGFGYKSACARLYEAVVNKTK